MGVLLALPTIRLRCTNLRWINTLAYFYSISDKDEKKFFFLTENRLEKLKTPLSLLQQVIRTANKSKG
jgi:hypothetical protein